MFISMLEFYEVEILILVWFMNNTVSLVRLYGQAHLLMMAKVS
jgi:hypothetical protein